MLTGTLRYLRSGKRPLKSLLWRNLGKDMAVNASANMTSEQFQPTLTVFSLLAMIFAVIAIFGNVLVILSFVRYKELRTIPNMIIANLSITDLLFPSMVVLWNTIYRASNLTVSKSVRCNIHGFQTYFFFLTSIYSLTFISVERYLATNYPLRHRRYITMAVVKRVLVGIWLWCVFCASTVFYVSKYVYTRILSHCTVDWLGQSLEISVFYLLISFLLPYVVLLYCNVFVIRAARRSQSMLRAVSSSSISMHENSRLRREHKVSLLIGMVIIAFTICWVPHIICIVFLLNSDIDMPQYVVSTSMVIAVCNSCVNPFIYGFMNKKFRKAFMNILCCRKSRDI